MLHYEIKVLTCAFFPLFLSLVDDDLFFFHFCSIFSTLSLSSCFSTGLTCIAILISYLNSLLLLVASLIFDFSSPITLS